MEVTNIKQVIVVRKDLNMRKGKMCAQVAHASMGALLNYKTGPAFNIMSFNLPDVVCEWLNGLFTKIVVSVDSEDELMDVYRKARYLGLNVCLIEDSGLTEFNGVKTKTCLAIGPNISTEIDVVTKELKLL